MYVLWDVFSNYTFKWIGTAQRVRSAMPGWACFYYRQRKSFAFPHDIQVSVQAPHCFLSIESHGNCWNMKLLTNSYVDGRAIAQAVSRWLPTAAARVRARVWWTEWRCGRFSLSTSVSSANLHSTKFSIIITITRGTYNRPFRGRRAEWIQYGLHPPLCE
jgi:hypothetical protein